MGEEGIGLDRKVNENRFGAPYKAPPLKGWERKGVDRKGEDWSGK